MTDDEYRDLIEQAHLLRELQKTDGYKVWSLHCARRVEAKKREMIGGVPKTVEAYRYTAGWIEGAEYALDALPQLDEKVTRERDRRKDKTAVNV